MHRLLLLLLLAVPLLGCPTEEPDLCEGATLDLPPPVGEAAGVWHEGSGRLVWFGGNLNPPTQCQFTSEYTTQTWAFNAQCDSYEAIEGSVQPPPRARHVAVLDEDGDRMLIHGGRQREATSGPYDLLNDTWALDLAEDVWTELSTTGGGPSPRSSHGGVAVGGKLWIFGGNESNDGLNYGPMDDLWSLDLGSLEWTEHDTTGTPGPRLFHGMTASADGASLYAFAGGDENAFFGPLFADLWELNLDTLTWTELHGGGGITPGGDNPSTRFSPDLMTMDDDTLLMFAGHDELTGPTNVVHRFQIADSDWDQLEEGDVYATPANGFCDFPADFTVIDADAPERRYFGVSGITDAGELITFGGRTDCGLINDTWSWTRDEGWVQRTSASSGEVCLRAFADCADLCTPQ